LLSYAENNRIMMLYRALLVLLVTLAGAVASETSLRGGEEDSSEATSKVKQDGVAICKRKGNKGYELTNLPPIYRLPGDSVPSMDGFVFDEMCQAVPVTCPCFTPEYFSATVNSEGCGPKFCIRDDPDYVGIGTSCGEGGCSGYDCGPPWRPGAPDKFSCDFRPDSDDVHFDDITAGENEACQAIIINEMFDCPP
jgi:hypothetical protein